MNLDIPLDSDNNYNNKHKNIIQQENNNIGLIYLKKPSNNIINENYNKFNEYQNNNINDYEYDNNISNIYCNYNNIEKEKIKFKFNTKASKEFINYQNQLRGYNEKKIYDSCKSFSCSNK
jgi:hypothetical protein